MLSLKISRSQVYSFFIALSLSGCANHQTNVTPENPHPKYIAEIWNKDASGKVTHQEFPLYKFNDYYEYIDTRFITYPSKIKDGEIIYEKNEIGHRIAITPVEDGLFDINFYYGKFIGYNLVNLHAENTSEKEYFVKQPNVSQQEVSTNMPLNLHAAANMPIPNWDDLPISKQRFFLGGISNFSTGESSAFCIFLTNE